MNGELADDAAIKRIEAAFNVAKNAAMALGHAADLYPRPNGADFGEADFLREGAWVILCTSFRERVIRRLFGNLSICFCNWVSARSIVDRSDICHRTALDVFRNEGKIDAIMDLVEKVDDEGFESVRARIVFDPISTLREFKYIGPVTVFHLAKNLGFQVAKPDRHLQRISERSSFSDAHELCSLIAEITSEPISVVDGVFWRLSELGLVDQFEIFELTSMAGLSRRTVIS